jgi:hypothetical protein
MLFDAEAARRRAVSRAAIEHLDRPPLGPPARAEADELSAASSSSSMGPTLGHLRTGGCGPGSLQEPWIDTTTPIGEAVSHITIAWVGLQKQTLSERTRARLERAREEGSSWAGHVGGRLLRTRVSRGSRSGPRQVLTRGEGPRRLRVRYATVTAAPDRSAVGGHSDAAAASPSARSQGSAPAGDERQPARWQAHAVNCVGFVDHHRDLVPEQEIINVEDGVL